MALPLSACVMEFAAVFEAFLGTVKLWLANARDTEVVALAALVADELRRRGLKPDAPQAEQET